MASPEWVIAKAKLNAQAHTSGWFSANKNVPLSTFNYSPVDELSAKVLRDPTTIGRFDASDLMPSSVGAGTFWTNMTQWILGNQSDQQTLDNIEKSWP
jgi:alpha-glucoside transport system substrate-binding protein